jgi:hypothetical protein
MNGDDLIQKLVDETMPNASDTSGESICDVIELENYFVKRLSKTDPVAVTELRHLKEVGIEFIFKEKLSVYRLDHNQEIWDFPANWSIFEMMDEGCSITVKSNHRHAHLLEVFSVILGKKLSAIEFTFFSGKLTCMTHEQLQEQLAAA